MKNSKKSTSHLENIIITTVILAALFFATGVVVWNYFPAKSVDIFVVDPISSTPTAPLITPDITPVIVEEPVTSSNLEESDYGVDSAMNTETKPGFIEQSMMGWKIIAGAITSPFTK